MDPRGKNAKERPVLLVSLNSEIQGSDDPETLLYGVAISGSCYEPLAPDQISLPWAADGSAHSGLTKKSTAVCRWLVEFRRKDIREVRGYIPADLLLRVVLAARGPTSEAPAPPGALSDLGLSSGTLPVKDEPSPRGGAA
jgi:hypothetical protein